MALLDIFRRKQDSQSARESNTLFGQSALGNAVVYQGSNQRPTVNTQILYVTTSGTTDAGRVVNMSLLTRNSTVMACIGAKARALAQLPITIMSESDDGSFVDAIKSPDVGVRDKVKAKQVINLLKQPNNFQSAYEFWYQFLMWLELSGETFTLWWRKDQDNPTQTPLEMYIMDSTLIAATITPTRYPSYRLSTPSYGFSKDEPLAAHQIMHIKESAWQGSAGFNKGILAAELIALDQDIDLYANYVMLNGAKPSGMFTTDQVIPDAKYKEISARNTQTMMDEFYKASMSPLLVNIEQKLKQHLFTGFPSLTVQFDTKDFLKGDPLTQMNFAAAGVGAGIMTPNEARKYMGMPNIEGADDLKQDTSPFEPIGGTSPQDTGGGGGSQKKKMAIGK